MTRGDTLSICIGESIVIVKRLILRLRWKYPSFCCHLNAICKKGIFSKFMLVCVIFFFVGRGPQNGWIHCELKIELFYHHHTFSHLWCRGESKTDCLKQASVQSVKRLNLGGMCTSLADFVYFSMQQVSRLYHIYYPFSSLRYIATKSSV